MRKELNIEQHMQTVQRLSPRQVQFVRLLEMNGAEIEDEVRRQLDDNPALESADPHEADSQNNHDTGTEEDPRDDISDHTVTADPDDDPADYKRPSRDRDADSMYEMQIIDDSPTIYDILDRQLGEISTDTLTRQVAQYIIGNLDENGYITRSLSAMADDIAIATGIDISREQMMKAFEIVRQLDPPGVGAVDLRDSLLLQLRRIKPTTLALRIAIDIVDQYFDLLSKKHYDRLQAQLGISDSADMQEALDLIRSLNPKPGAAIAATSTLLRTNQITPDVAVERSEDGLRYTVSLLNSIPALQIEKSFATETDTAVPAPKGKAGAMQRQAQAFIKLKRDDAEAFISAIKQRAATLITVAEAIVKLQPEFFETDDTSTLRPMILKDVGQATGLDLSVISRATAGKYLATDAGVYPLKMFFNEAPQDDSDTSSHKIMQELKDIIDEEDKRHPLSDEAIKDAITKRGYNLARRTVTKYREKMGIPVGRLRKNL